MSNPTAQWRARRGGLARVAASVAGLCLAAGVAWAQPAAPPPVATPPVERLDFDAAIARAVEHNTDVSRAAQVILRAEALLQQARVIRKPSVGANAQVTVLDTERGFQGNVTQPQTQSVIGGSVSYPVLAAAGWAAATQAGDQVALARLGAADVRRQVATAAGQAYLEVIAEQRQVEVAERAIENASAHLDYARSRLEAGAGSKLNELRASQELETDRVLLEAATLALTSAREALGVLVAADGPVDATGEPAFELPSAPAPGDEGWLMRRADITLFDAAVEAADRVVRDSWKDWVPTATVAFQPQLVYPAGLFQPSRTWQAVLQVDVPIFDGGSRRAAKRERETARETARIDLEDAERRARSELRVAEAAVASAERAVSSARLAAQHAADVVRITDIAFRAGATTNLELIDAQRTARDADTAAAQAEDRVRRARFDLLVALGLFPQ